MKASTRKIMAPFGAALFIAVSTTGSAAAGDWTWTATPYVWATDVGADVSINDRQVADKTIDFSDLAEDLSLAAQGHMEGRNGRHGVLLDLFYVHLADDDKRFPLPAPLAGEAIADGDLTLTILDAGGIWNPRGDGEGFSLIYGGRMVDRDIEIDARFQPAPGVTLARSYEVSETLYDGLLGARYAGRFTPRWTWAVQADASTGGTEQTWSALAGLGWSFGSRYTFLAGYRYMDIQFEKDDALPGEVDADVTLSGFFTGLRIAF
ncbi:MAG: hypothetical protein ABUT39_16715 [Acidobacteriota bacterium]